MRQRSIIENERRLAKKAKAKKKSGGCFAPNLKSVLFLVVSRHTTKQCSPYPAVFSTISELLETDEQKSYNLFFKNAI